MRFAAALVLISVALSGCANEGLRQIRGSGNGPDEFIVQPAKPLQQPDSYTSLPAPTRGGANLTDSYPLQAGVAAFGGRQQDPNGPVPANDAALVQYSGRLGVTPGIRTSLSAEDAEFRRKQARFTQIRIVPTDYYNKAYRRQALDSYAEAARWQRAGARTPTAPPPQ